MILTILLIELVLQSSLNIWMEKGEEISKRMTGILAASWFYIMLKSLVMAHAALQLSATHPAEKICCLLSLPFLIVTIVAMARVDMVFKKQMSIDSMALSASSA